jgi:hypothetical protein
MMLLATVGLLGGALLALRFRAPVLFPAILIATPIVTVRGIAAGADAKILALTVFGVVAALQVGYMVGCVLRATVGPHTGAAERVALPT